MADSPTTEGTQAQGGEHAGLPQMDVTTFPSQLFWLAITFGFLFVVLWRIVMPRLNYAIATRNQTINGDLEAAEKAKTDAQGAQAAYEASLANARTRAMALADENRKRIAGEIETLKAKADAEAQAAMSAAEARIAATRTAALGNVKAAAGEAAAAIVEKLIGEQVGADEAIKAVPTGGR